MRGRSRNRSPLGSLAEWWATYAASLRHGSVDDRQRLDEPSWVRERRDRTCNSGSGRNALRKPLMSPRYPISFTATAEVRFPATKFGGSRRNSENLRYSENATERGKHSENTIWLIALFLARRDCDRPHVQALRLGALQQGHVHQVWRSHFTGQERRRRPDANSR